METAPTPIRALTWRCRARAAPCAAVRSDASPSIFTPRSCPAMNIMPVTIELMRAGGTMGDVVERLKLLWGTYRERPVF